MLLFEFLNRISFFSVLTWCFFFISVLSAVLLTTWRTPKIRRYRSVLTGTASSAMILGIFTWSLPFLMSRFGPDQSRMTPIAQLTPTEWIEPVSNPETEVVDEEISWAKVIGYQFRYKLTLGFEFQRSLPSGLNTMVLLDRKGNLHGFNAYSGLNHWWIHLRMNQYLGSVSDMKKLFLLERTSLDALRISCVDLSNPALLWQRTIPRSKEGALSLDADSQTLYLSSGSNGVWAMKSKTGEILWKRPELYSKAKVLATHDHVVVFEPAQAGLEGHWYRLNSSSGQTTQRLTHPMPQLQFWDAPQATAGLSGTGLGLHSGLEFFLLNLSDLSSRWTQSADEEIESAGFLGERLFYTYSLKSRLELRDLGSGSLLWQKRLNPQSSFFLKVSPDAKLFSIPSMSENETPGISFFESTSGDYRGTARGSEALQDLYYSGDWLYLLSENHLWAYKRPPEI